MSELYSVGRDVARVEERISDHELNAELHTGASYECGGCAELRTRVEALEMSAAAAVEAAAVATEAAADAEQAAAAAEAAASEAHEESADAEAAAAEAAAEVEAQPPEVVAPVEPPAAEAEQVVDVAPERAHLLHRRIGG